MASAGRCDRSCTSAADKQRIIAQALTGKMLDDLLIGCQRLVILPQSVVALPLPVIGRPPEGALRIVLMDTREGIDGPLVIAVLIPIQSDLILRFIAEEGARNRACHRVPEQTSRTGDLWSGFTPLFQGGQIDLLACFSGNFLERWGQFLRH